MSSKKEITDEEYKNLSWSEKRDYVCEWKCKCNSCGRVWHYLDSVERNMKSTMSANAFTQLGNCCNPCVAAPLANANTQLNKQIADLKSCPDCKSSDVKKEERYFKKQ